MKVFLTVSFSLLVIMGWAQEVQPSPQTHSNDSVRSYYIKDFPDHFFVYPVLKRRTLNFELEREKSPTGLVAFRPNNAYSFGVGLYLFEVGFELTFAVPIDEKSIRQYGESKARDIQFNLLGKRWGLDAIYQRYRGFYVTDSRTDVPAGDPYPQRPDISTRNAGLTASYTFNHQRFSFRSSYNFAERQLFSKGSVIALGSISGFRLSADSSILNTAQTAIFGEDAGFTNFRFTSISVAPGYTYTVVFKNFFLNGTLALGPAHHWISYTPEGRSSKDNTTLNTFVAARISLGYNGERLFGGISFISQGSNVRIGDTEFTSNNGSFKMLIGYRFNETRVLKKRVWDLLPFKI